MVKANNEYDARSAEIIFTDKESGTVEKVKVTQKQQDAIIVAQKEYTVEAKGGNVSFDVNTNVDFKVSVSDSWIKQITTRALSTKALRFTIDENSSESERSGSITLQGNDITQIITIRQTGKSNINSGGDIEDMPVQPW